MRIRSGTIFVVVIALAVGGVAGVLWARKVKMIEMPQTVALLNGIGGLASALVGGLELAKAESSVFGAVTAALALVIARIRVILHLLRFADIS